jgi:hypothetical protein
MRFLAIMLGEIPEVPNEEDFRAPALEDKYAILT